MAASVPTIEDTTQPEPLKKVRPIPGFESYAPLEAFGGESQVSGEVEKTAMSADEHYRMQKRLADETFTKQAYSQALDYVNETLYGPKGYTQQHGQNTFDSYEPTSDAINSKFEDIINSAKNDQQKQYLKQMLSQLEPKAKMAMLKHSANESKLVEAQAGQNLNNSLINNSVMSLDKKLAEDNIQKIIANDQHLGVNPDKDVSEHNFRFVNSLIDAGRPHEAQQYANSHFLDAAHANILEPHLIKAITRRDAETEAKSILASTTNVKDAIDKADTIADPDKSELAKKEILRQSKIQENAEKMTQDSLFMNSVKAINDAVKNSGGNEIDPAKIVGSSWDTLDLKHQKALAALADPSKNMNRDAYHKFSTLSDSEIEAMGKPDFYREYYPFMNPADKRNAEKLFNGLHPGGDRATAAGIKVPKEMLSQSLGEVGMVSPGRPYSKWTQSQQTNYGLLADKVERAEEDYLAINGKKPGTKELREIIDNQMKDFTRPGLIFGTNTKKMFQMTINDVPQDIRKSLATAAGGNLSDEQTVRLFQAWKSKDKKMVEAIINEGK